MDEIFLKLSEIIKTGFICQQNGEKLILQDSTSKPVEIKKKGKLICLQLDKGNINIFPFFNQGVKHLCKIADRMLFYSKEDCLFVFIVELKTVNTKDAVKQVKASYILSEYLCKTIRRMLNFKTLEIKYRGLVFSNKTFKGTTDFKNLDYEEVPNTELKYKHLQSGQSINLDTLTF